MRQAGERKREGRGREGGRGGRLAVSWCEWVQWVRHAGNGISGLAAFSPEVDSPETLPGIGKTQCYSAYFLL